jgi:hypothetical protein
MDLDHSIRLSSLEEPEIEAVLLQLENHELRQLSRKYLRPEFPIDSRVIAQKLAMNMNFTLQTKLHFSYDSY